MSDSTQRPVRPRKGNGRKIALGAGAGLVFGAAFGNLAIGMMIGAALGLAVGVLFAR